MSDMPEGLNRLFRAASSEHNPEGCDECRGWLPSFVEAETAGEDVSLLYPQVLAHLDTCADCDEEYAALLDLALMEAQGQLPQPGEYAELRLPRPLRLRRLVRQITQAVLAALDPESIGDLGPVAQAFFEQLAETPGRLTLQKAALPMGLGGLESETLPTLMATYYTLTTLLEKHSAVELQTLAEQGGLEKELRQTARQEAKRQALRGKAERVFVDHFVQQALGDLSSLINLASG